MLTAAAPPEGPQGVAGWLLLLCVVMTVLAPISAGVVALMNLRADWSTLHQSVRVIVGVETFGLIVAGAFACYAGSRLWSLDSRGPTLARYALAAHPALRLFLIPMAFFLPTDRNLAWQLVQHAGSEFFRSLPGAIIWIIYLTVSKRVAATYDEP